MQTACLWPLNQWDFVPGLLKAPLRSYMALYCVLAWKKKKERPIHTTKQSIHFSHAPFFETQSLPSHSWSKKHSHLTHPFISHSHTSCQSSCSGIHERHTRLSTESTSLAQKISKATHGWFLGLFFFVFFPFFSSLLYLYSIIRCDNVWRSDPEEWLNLFK